VFGVEAVGDSEAGGQPQNKSLVIGGTYNRVIEFVPVSGRMKHHNRTNQGTIAGAVTRNPLPKKEACPSLGMGIRVPGERYVVKHCGPLQKPSMFTAESCDLARKVKKLQCKRRDVCGVSLLDIVTDVELRH
jgi:hypothetical protein